jgi:hypothetical protein
MFTIRNIGGVALFLFGTTFLWLTPTFATRGSTKGAMWSVTQVLSLATVAGFTIATWGLSDGHPGGRASRSHRQSSGLQC